MTLRQLIGSREDSLPPAALLLVAWESSMTPSRPDYTKKTPLQKGGSSYFLIVKSPKSAIFYIHINTLDIIVMLLVGNRSRKKYFYFRPF